MQGTEFSKKNIYNYYSNKDCDQNSKENNTLLKKNTKYPSFFKRGFFKTIFFKWLSPLIDVSSNGQYITDNHINEADDDNDIRSEYERFIYNWNKEFSDPEKIKSIQLSTIKVILRTFNLRITSIILFKLVFDIIHMLRPWQVHGVLHWINDPNGTRLSGIWRFTSIVICEIVSGSILQQYFRRSFSLSIMLKGVLNYSLSHKLVNLPKNLAHENISKCISLFSSESTYLLGTGNTLLAVPSMIFQNILLLFSLYKFIGVSAFIGYIIIVLSLFINGVLLKTTQSVRMKYIDSMDKRISLSNELVQFFKQIKCYAWETYYIENISNIRNEELRHLAIWRFLNQLGFVLATLCISLSPVISFGSFLFITRSFPVDVIFTSLLIFEALQLTLVLMPTGLSSLQKVMNCYTRLSEFLLLKESTPKKMIEDSNKNDLAIIMKDLSFNYPSKSYILNSINIDVKKKETVGIIGSVGSGKTTLIELIIQEINPTAGSIETCGSIFYCPQISWIINGTIRNNIILDLPYNKTWYDTVINACSLTYDIKAMPNGDLTEIGENGVNLSGGQKQRVSLARAVYQNPDILVLDDVFSALDNVVANSIFQKCILNLMKEKTVILATNKLDLLVHLDKVAFINNQMLSYYGLPDNTFFSHSEFQDLLKNMNKVQDQISQLIDDVVPIEEIEGIEESSLNNNESSSNNDDSIGKFKISNTITNMNTELEEIGKDFSPLNSISSSSGNNQLSNLNSNLANEITPLSRSRKGSRVSLSVLKEKYRRESQVKGLFDSNVNALPTEKQTTFKFDQNKVNINKVEMSLYISFIKKIRFKIFFVSLTIIYACTFLSIVSSTWISIWSKNFDKYGIMKGLLILSGINFMQPILNLAFRMTNIYMTAYASKRIYTELLEKLTFSKMSFYESIPIGTILSRITGDIVVIDELIPQNLNDLLYCFSRVTIYIGYFIYLDYRFLFLFIPISYLFNKVRDRALSANRQLKRIYHSRNSPILTSISHTIEGLAVLKCSKFGLSSFLVSIRELIDYETAPWRCYCLVQRWLGIRVDMLGACVMSSLGIFCVLAKNYISIGAIAIAFQCSMSLTQLVLWFIRNISETENNFLSFERVVELIENTPQEQTLRDYQFFEKEKENVYSDSLLINVDKSNIILKDWPTNGKIEFKNVSLQYNSFEFPVLNDLNFSISAGKKVGICGRTGSGKSSLLSAILRLYNLSKGSILIDDVDISQISLKQLRSLITIIPQEPNILTGTLRYNLDPFSEYTNEEMQQALINSNSISFVNSLPDGIDTQMNSISSNISLGQKQLICLARALLRKSKIILLDEATSSVDIATDNIIQEIIKKHFSNCTILSVAHRIHTIIDFDLIIVLDKGRIVEYDTPQNLLSNTSSVFYSIANEVNSL